MNSTKVNISIDDMQHQLNIIYTQTDDAVNYINRGELASAGICLHKVQEARAILWKVLVEESEVV